VTWRERLTEWLDIRPAELRVVVLSFLGAFLVMGFVVLAGSLRDAFYLGFFDAATLPYVLYASVALGLPAAGMFSRQMARRAPHRVMRILITSTGLGLVAFYFAVLSPEVALNERAAAVGFYLWTVVAALLLTTGFWIVASEVFVVREAKRLFGLISSGGALGTLVTGVSIAPLLGRFAPVSLIPIVVAFLALALLTFELIPRERLRARTAVDESGGGVLSGLRDVAGNRHLRLVATIILLAAAAAYIVDWQLKEAIQASALSDVRAAGLTGDAAVTATNRRIASFMGAFRGWTGGLAFVIQVFLASRILTGAGVAWSLAVLPLALMLGSVGMLVVPGLLMATLVRGADNTLGKSLYRTVVELLWVPIPSSLRRRRKAFIDSLVGNAGDGLGALVVLLWVTLGGRPSFVLSAFVILTCAVLLYLSRAMGAQYFTTLRSRLETSRASSMLEGAWLERGDRLGSTLTRLDISRVLATTGIHFDAAPGARPAPAGKTSPEQPLSPSEMLQTGDPALVRRALASSVGWTLDDVPALARLLARDGTFGVAVTVLAEIGPDVVPLLAPVLRDEAADFVVRRRIPRVLSRIESRDADRVLLEGLGAGRFEVRYRVALALRRRRQRGLPEASGDWQSVVWKAVRAEVSRERPVWELARLLDSEADDGLVERRVGLRGELSLEHTFRLLSLVLEPRTVQAAYHGIVLDDPELESFALEYMEQVLPPDIRKRLWPFIGDMSASAERRAIRKLDDVVADLLQTGATLFGTPESREELQRYLRGDGEERPD
jgi:ATP/ADP translocase